MITAVDKGFVVTEASYGRGQHRIDLSVEQYKTSLNTTISILLSSLSRSRRARYPSAYSCYASPISTD